MDPWAIRRARGPARNPRAGARPAAPGEPAWPRVGWAPLPGLIVGWAPLPGPIRRIGARPRAEDGVGTGTGRAGPGRPDGQRTGRPAERGGTRKTRSPPGNAEPSGYPGPSIDGQGGWRRLSAARRVRPRALMVHNVERSALFSSGRVDAELSRPALSRVAARRRAVRPRAGMGLLAASLWHRCVRRSMLHWRHAIRACTRCAFVSRGSRGPMRPCDVPAAVGQQRLTSTTLRAVLTSRCRPVQDHDTYAKA